MAISRKTLPEFMTVTGGFRKATTFRGWAVKTLADMARGMLDRLAAKQKFPVPLRANARGLLL
jgi:hypothetical protein